MRMILQEAGKGLLYTPLVNMQKAKNFLKVHLLKLSAVLLL